MTEPDDDDAAQAIEILRLHGSDAVPHLLHLVEEAVERGDDGEVARLDHLLRAVEKAIPDHMG